MVFSVFENALNYWFVAASALRIALGIITIVLATRALGKERHQNIQTFTRLGMLPGKFFAFTFGFVILVCGILLIIGLFTQVAALLLGTISVLMILSRMTGKTFSNESDLFFTLLAIVSFSIIYFGAGSIALDLPL